MDASGVSDVRDRLGVTLLAVCPHPDDESSATGGLLAYYHARGVRTGVVICTGGEEL
jgi:LmbE family N-acetylglucosaminyl deacetylase